MLVNTQFLPIQQAVSTFENDFREKISPVSTFEKANSVKMWLVSTFENTIFKILFFVSTFLDWYIFRQIGQNFRRNPAGFQENFGQYGGNKCKQGVRRELCGVALIIA